MEVIIRGVKDATHSPSWESLQALIRSMYPESEDRNVEFIRIARMDRKCSYRMPGVYEVGLMNGETLTVTVK